jgi:Fe-S-cluster-containing dehydrogenase component
LAVAIEGATIIREHQGFYVNVLVYKQRCDACGYCAPTNSFAVAQLTYGTYDIRGFACPSCVNRQEVRVRLGFGEEEAAFLIAEE